MSLEALCRAYVRPSPHKYGCVSPNVGVSSTFFFIPALFICIPSGYILSTILLFAVALISFLSDYFCRGTSFDVIDRWTAGSAFLYFSSRIYELKGTNQVMIIWIIACLLLGRSRSSRSSEEWAENHTMWHIGMSIITLYICLALSQDS